VDLDGVKTTLNALRDSIIAFEAQDITKENARLREQVEQFGNMLEESRTQLAGLQGSYDSLEQNFKHELTSKRLALLGLSKKQHMEYLALGLEKECAEIESLYANLNREIALIKANLRVLDDKEREPLVGPLADLSRQVRQMEEQARMRRGEAWSNISKRHSAEMDELAQRPIEDAAVYAVRKFFRWETFLGLKLISAAGALMLLLGVFTFGRFLYDRMGAGLQCLAIFLLGFTLMAAGEALYRKNWRGGFTLALTASGSGVLFLGAALGHMTLNALPMWAALTICAGVSLLTFAAALRYNAQLVAVFALVGGYLPLIALEESIVLFGAVYFTILSLLALLIATRKNWRVARFIGLGAGLIAQMTMMDFGFRSASNTAVEAVIGAAIVIGFITYLVIPVFGAWFTKTRIKAADIVLLSSNIFFSFLTMQRWGEEYLNMAISIRRGYSAYIAAFFAVCCIAMALIVERQKHSGVPESETGSLRALFFITSVTFTALVVLFALDSMWFSIGWLIQAAGLSLYGIFKNRRRFNIAGLVIGVFCLLSFLLNNIPWSGDRLFVWQYLSITLTAFIVSVAALKCKTESRSISIWLDIFRCAAAINLWGYVVYLLHRQFIRIPLIMPVPYEGSAAAFAALGSIVFGFILAFALPRIKRVYNRGFHIAAIVLGVINALWLLSFNARGLQPGTAVVDITAFALFIIINIIAIGWINDLLRFLCGVRRLPPVWYPLLFSGFAVLLAAQNLVVQLSLRPQSLILTLLFGLTALGWVLYGFIRRNGVTRVSGLAMSFFAVLKLFVLDLHGLDTVWRIVCYITAGTILLAISFSYQWFGKRLSLDGGSQPMVK
jgi:uncharacterized membrane protein